jgi:hypothetical protein
MGTEVQCDAKMLEPLQCALNTVKLAEKQKPHSSDSTPVTTLPTASALARWRRHNLARCAHTDWSSIVHRPFLSATPHVSRLLLAGRQLIVDTLSLAAADHL